MGRGSQEAAYQGSLLYAKITGTKPKETVHFELSRPNPDDKKNPFKEGSERKLTGYLVGAAHRTFTWENNVIDTVALTLNDPAAGKEGETYKVEFTAASSLGRSIINSLLGADNFLAPLTLSLYNNKENGYASVGVYLGGDQAKWKYSIDDQSKYVTTEKKKVKNAEGKLVTQEVKNYLELNDFLLKEFKEKVVPMVKPRITAAGAIASKATSEQEPEYMVDDTQSAVAEGGGLPWEQ
jgi:hypothetical protein